MASFDFEMASFDFEMASFDFARLRLATLRTNGCRDHGSVLRSWETLVNWMVSFDFEMASFDFARPSTGSGLATLRTNGFWKAFAVRPEHVESFTANGRR